MAGGCGRGTWCGSTRMDTGGLRNAKKSLSSTKGMIPNYILNTRYLSRYRNQVAPAELEAHLNSHPWVSEGTVCALWDDALGTEVPIAYIALTPEARTSGLDRDKVLADVREHVDSRVAAYKRLRGGVVVLDEIPKSGNGKVLRRLLPARLARDRKGRL